MFAILIGYVLLRVSEAVSKYPRLSWLLFGKRSVNTRQFGHIGCQAQERK